MPRVIRDTAQISQGNIFRSLDIAASGMTAQRRRMDAISSNIANISTTNADGNGNPYLRKHVQMGSSPRSSFERVLWDAELNLKRTREGHIDPASSYRELEKTPNVEGSVIELPNQRLNVIYDPTNPDADAQGFVVMPDVNMVEEMVDLMIASRAFEANITVANAAKQLITKSLEI